MMSRKFFGRSEDPRVDTFANTGGSRFRLQLVNHGGSNIDGRNGNTSLREVDCIIAGATPQVQYCRT